MNQNPDLSIVIVNYNTKDYTAQCIDSIYQHPLEIVFDIVVVDNASIDGSADWLEAHYPQVKLVRSPKNRGIAGGNNLGIEASSGEYILLLNNDTLVLPGTIYRSVDFLEVHPEAAGVGGSLLNPDGSFQSGYFDFHTLWSVFLDISQIGRLFHRYYPSHSPCDEVRQVDWMSTAFMVFRRQALESIDFVDEEFFIYSDETDLQFRLKQVGWKIFYLPELKTIHFGGKSLTPWRRRCIFYRGYLLYFKKHRGLIENLLLRIIFVVVTITKMLCWGVLFVLPDKHERAKHELGSYVAILRMSLQSGIVPP